MKVMDKKDSYQAFIARESTALIEDLKGIAFTTDFLANIIGGEKAYELAKGLSREKFDSWLELGDNKEHGDGIIQIINFRELNEYISNVLQLGYVEQIFEFYKSGKYELWVIVNDYDINVCKEIYASSLNLCNVNILIIEEAQLDYEQMPEPNFVFKQ